MHVLTAEEMIDIDIQQQEGMRNAGMSAYNQEQLRNYVPTDEQIAFAKQSQYELARYMRIKRKGSAIFTIKNSAFF